MYCENFKSQIVPVPLTEDIQSIVFMMLKVSNLMCIQNNLRMQYVQHTRSDIQESFFQSKLQKF